MNRSTVQPLRRNNRPRPSPGGDCSLVWLKFSEDTLFSYTSLIVDPIYSAPSGGEADNAKISDGNFLITDMSTGGAQPIVQIDFGSPRQFTHFSITGLSFDNYRLNAYEIQYTDDPTWTTYIVAKTFLGNPSKKDFSDTISGYGRYIRLVIVYYGTNGKASIDSFVVSVNHQGGYVDNGDIRPVDGVIYTAPWGGQADNARFNDESYVLSNNSNGTIPFTFLELDFGYSRQITRYLLDAMRTFDFPDQRSHEAKFEIHHSDDSSWKNYAVAVPATSTSFLPKKYSGSINGRARYVRLFITGINVQVRAHVNVFVVN